MPFSLDPQPKEDEIECGQCGALIYDQLSRCPHCGVNLYEPEVEYEQGYNEAYQGRGNDNKSLLSRIRDCLKRLTGSPYSTEEVLGIEMDHVTLYRQLLTRVGGDHLVLDRLVQFEQRQAPDGNRTIWLKNALTRWERDNTGRS